MINIHDPRRYAQYLAGYDEVFKNGDDPPTITIGDTCAFIRGVGDYSYDHYKIAPRFSADYNTGIIACSGYSVYDIEWSTSATGPDTADCWPSQYNQTYVTVCGVVTAVTEGTYNQFYIQVLTLMVIEC